MKKNMLLPMSRKEINAWCRYYYNFHPVISNWIDSIVAVVYSDFDVRGPNASRFREEFFDNEGRFRHENVAFGAAQEMNLIGESFIYNYPDSVDSVVLNSDYVEVGKSSLVKKINMSLIADEELQRVVASKNKADVEIVKSLDPAIVECIKANQSIPLDEKMVSYFMNLAGPYDTRGTSPIVKYLKVLSDPKAVIVEHIRREANSPAFIKSLKKQRSFIESWIKMSFKRYAKANNLKSIPVIKWKKPITKKSFTFIGVK